MESTRAGLYVRQSLKRDEGIDRQLRRCRSLVDARGWAEADVYSDNDTSATKARNADTQWARLLADAEAGRIDVVVAVNLDRLARSVHDILTLSATGVGIATLEGDLDTTTADGKFRAQLLASLAEFETSRKRERQERANADRAARGRPNPGRRRYGMQPDGRTPVPDEAAIVRRIYDAVADGRSLGSIVRELQAESVPPGTASSWSNRQVRNIAMNPAYRGAVIHRGVAYDSDHVAPIVDREVWDKVQTVLNDPTRRTTPGNSPKHLLSSIATCATCGATLFYRNAYICRASAAHCYMVEEQADAAVREGVATAVLEIGEIQRSAGGGNHSVLVAEHARLTRALTATAEDRDMGILPHDVARERLRTLTSDRTAIEAELQAVRAAQAADAMLVDLLQDLLGDARTISVADVDAIRVAILDRYDALDFDRKREAIRGLVTVKIHKGRAPDRIVVTTNFDRAAPVDPEADLTSVLSGMTGEGESRGPGRSPRRAPREGREA
ncbi:recombinase family protein [Microbacterium sp. NPDC077184]|uniref:recombinase family protein n=1 Tax=Microbacterium sp. NPDC077184 TaxID=3154764 RepID=UPI003446F56E